VSATAEVLRGQVERVVYAAEASGWSVVRLRVPGRREAVTVVGRLFGVRPGERLRVTGAWAVDPRWGEQFRAEGFVSLQPDTAAGIERYLGSGLVRGVGPKLAARLVALFGLETLDVIERQPERLTEAAGVGPIRAERIRSAWAEQRAIRDVMVFLQGHGVSPALAVRIWRRYEARSTSVVREDPYRLAEEVPGIGFRTADRIAAGLGVAPDSPERLRAGVLHALHRLADEGHVYAERGTLLQTASRLLAPKEGGGPDPEAVAAQLDALADSGRLEVDVVDGRARVSLPALAAAERGVVSALLRLLRAPSGPAADDPEAAAGEYERRAGLRLAPLQRQAVAASLREKVLVVTGGPGTGKTTLVRGVVSVHARRGRRVLLCAPTGRAAQRLGEATGMEAKTIHRLLEFDPRSQRFARDERNPLAADLLVADEASMIDTALMYALLRAVPSPARVVLVGDRDQLPSVGPGQVLADLIDSGAVPVVRLSQVFRQARESRVVLSAHRINEGRFPVTEGGRDDFFWIEKDEPAEILALVLRLVAEAIPRRFGLSPLDDVQVLTPMRRGTLGAANLNQELQRRLNPEGAPVRHGLRVGDKVMQLENDYERDVFNGDVGRIERFDEEEGRLRVRFGDRGVLYDARDVDGLAMAYACTVHKAQGSEYPAVVVPLHTEHYPMLQRRLLYTAVTRGRRLVVLVGSRRALGVALRSRGLLTRNTQLAERLRRAWAGASAT
jgi:exodeoxyribonuclease V alpha subunit